MTRREFCRETAGVGASMAALTALGSLPASAGTFESDELTYMSASELLPLFRARRLSPVEVLEAQIARIEDKNPAVKAVNDTYFDEAMKAARASEKRYMDGTTRPLEGLTLAVKDEHTIAGKITTNGSLLRENDVQAETAIIVERMQEAGVIIHARTTTPENSFAMVTWSLLWGITRNPWNLYYTCGGSSGGSSAATATGMTTLATGSDLAGSIRIPASVNGLYGFKPPRGRVPVLMPGSMAPWWSDGPLARTYEDMVMFQNTVAGPDLRDMYSLKPKMVIPDRLLGVQGMRIALCVNMGFFRVAPEVEANLRAAATAMEAQGAIIEEVTIPWDADTCHNAFRYNVFGSTLGAGAVDFLDNKDQLTTYVAYLAEEASKVTREQRLEGGPLLAKMHQQFVDSVWAKGYDVMVTPTIANEGVRADFDITKHEVTINGEKVNPLLDWVMTWPFNALNRYPAITVPNGRASNGVPTGMQIVGPTLDDIAAFRVAQAHSRSAEPLFVGDRFPDFRKQA